MKLWSLKTTSWAEIQMSCIFKVWTNDFFFSIHLLSRNSFRLFLQISFYQFDFIFSLHHDYYFFFPSLFSSWKHLQRTSYYLGSLKFSYSKCLFIFPLLTNDATRFIPVTFGLSVWHLASMASGIRVSARVSRTGPAIGWERIIKIETSILVLTNIWDHFLLSVGVYINVSLQTGSWGRMWFLCLGSYLERLWVQLGRFQLCCGCTRWDRCSIGFKVTGQQVQGCFIIHGLLRRDTGLRSVGIFWSIELIKSPVLWMWEYFNFFYLLGFCSCFFLGFCHFL